MKKSFLFLALTSLLALTSCTKNNKNNKVDPKKDEFVNGIKDEQRTFYKGQRNKSKITLRFYEETPSIPYIDLTTYFKTFYFLNLNKTKVNENGKYRYEGKSNTYLEVDTINETFTFSDIDTICNLSQFNLEACFLKPSVVSLIGTPDIYIEFSEYHIDLKGDDKEAYMPLTTLDNIFSWVMGYCVSYNGKDVYVLDESWAVYEYSSLMNYPDYYDVLENKETFAKDEAEFNYNELCFTIDYLQGHPAQMAIGRSELEAGGLDAALDAYPRLKQALKSTNVKEYVDAQYLFHDILMYDGGHSGAQYRMYSGTDYMSQILNEDSLLKQKNDYVDQDWEDKYAAYQSVGITKINALGSQLNYYYADKTNKIAYIGFDQFDVDYQGWQMYYLGFSDQIPNENDTYGFLYTQLQQAKTDGIEYIVFDITTNGGGDTVALHGTLSFLQSGDTSMIYKNTISGHIMKEVGKVDRNLDGQFTAADNEFDFDFKYGLLTSKWSFSCGNALPTYVRDLNLPILGERSGGGSCCVSYYNDAHGIRSRVSTIWKLLNKDYYEKDDGVAVDYNLKTVDGSYIDFFNTSKVKSKLAEFYSF